MSSFKQLNKSDVTHVPYAANKQWNLTYSSGYPKNDGYVTIYKGTNLTSSFNSIMDPVTEGQYEGLVYDSINHLFYHSFSGSLLDTSSLAMSPLYVSASQQYATSSYFIYDENPKFRNYFPTGANEGIRVLGFNQEIFGSKLLPYNFILSSSAYYITDDGNGNVLDNNNTYVGNIFYPQGLVIITNQDYQNMFPLPPLAVADIINVKASDYDKTGSILANDLARFGSLVTSSITLSGSVDQLSMIKLTGSYNTTASMISGSYKFFQQGTYDAYYTVNSTGSFGQLTSNKALIRFNVGAPDCDFSAVITYIQPTPTPTPTTSVTQTPTPTTSVTNTPTNTQTSTPTNTPTNTQTSTPTNTQTSTPTNTPTPTTSVTNTPTQTPTPTTSVTNTPTQTPTPTTSVTNTPTPTTSVTNTPTPTPTATLLPASFIMYQDVGQLYDGCSKSIDTDGWYQAYDPDGGYIGPWSGNYTYSTFRGSNLGTFLTFGGYSQSSVRGNEPITISSQIFAQGGICQNMYVYINVNGSRVANANYDPNNNIVINYGFIPSPNTSYNSNIGIAFGTV